MISSPGSPQNHRTGARGCLQPPVDAKWPYPLDRAARAPRVGVHPSNRVFAGLSAAPLYLRSQQVGTMNWFHRFLTSTIDRHQFLIFTATLYFLLSTFIYHYSAQPLLLIYPVTSTFVFRDFY